MKQLIFLTYYLLLSFASAIASPAIIDANSYNFKADGQFNDYDAFQKMMNDAIKKAETGTQVEVRLPANKKIYLNRPAESYITYVINLYDVSHITVNGNNSTLLLGKRCRFVKLNKTTGIVIKNFKTRYSPSPFLECEIVDYAKDYGYIDVRALDPAEQGLIMSNFSVDAKQEHPFAMIGVYVGDHLTHERYSLASPNGKVISKAERLSADLTRVYHPRGVLGIGAPYVGWAVKKGSRISFPRPGIGNYKGNHVQLGGNSHLVMENIHIADAPKFNFSVQMNPGPMLFKNIKVKPVGNAMFTSFRDMWHFKGNRGKTIFDSIEVEGPGDDTFNICTRIKVVSSVKSPTKLEILQYLPGGTHKYKVGETLCIVDNGSVVGEAKIKKYQEVKIPEEDKEAYIRKKYFWNKSVENPIMQIELDKAIPGIKNGMVAYTREDTPEVIFSNSIIKGSTRLQASATYINCEIIGIFTAFALRFEGPGPEYLRFENCVFKPGRRNYPTSFGLNMGGNGNAEKSILRELSFKNCKIYGQFMPPELEWPPEVKYKGKPIGLDAQKMIFENNQVFGGPNTLGEFNKIIQKNNTFDGKKKKIYPFSEGSVQKSSKKRR